MNGDQNQNNRFKFDSSDIGKKKRLNYFEGRVKKSPIKDFIKSVFDGKNKFITIGIIVATVIVIAVFVLWLTIWRYAASNTGTLNNSDDVWNQQLAETANEANDIFNADSENSFIEAVNYFDTKIEAEEDSNRLFDLRLSRAVFLNNSGSFQMAIDDLITIDESLLTDEQLYRLYLTLAFSYRQIDNDESAEIYDEKINALPSSVTNIGG